MSAEVRQSLSRTEKHRRENGHCSLGEGLCELSSLITLTQGPGQTRTLSVGVALRVEEK